MSLTRRHGWVILSLTLFHISSACANYEFLGRVDSIRQQDRAFSFYCEGQQQLDIRFITSRIVRITFNRAGLAEPLLDYSLIPLPDYAVQASIIESDSIYRINSSELEVLISKYPCRITIRNRQGEVICADDPGMGIGWEDSEVRCWKSIANDERFFGLGMKVGDVNKRGREWVMWNSDVPAYGWQSDPLYESIPFFVGLRDDLAYGIYFNNSYRTRFNMGAGNLRYYSFAAEDGPLDYFFFYGPEIARVVEDYTAITGRMNLPPLWALGYQQCRWSYYPESEVRELARAFREKQIPADAIYLDIHYMDDYRVFTWHPERFPNPQKLLNDLAKDGFHVVTIVDPGVKADSQYAVAREGLEHDYFVTYPDGQTYIGEVWPGPSFFPDFSNPEAGKWWSGHIQDWLKTGVSGIWNDMNEPAVWGSAFPLETIFNDDGRYSSHKKMHNLYALLMAKTTYEGALAAYPNRRPFILTRAGFAGIQRYSAVWTGDNIASWDHLALGIRIMLGMGLSGVPFVGTDVGGFIGTPSGELYARWLQVGALSPLFRTHSEYNTNLQEPWSYGQNPEDINRRYIELRYRLLPYFYSLFHEAAQTGTPILQPLFWNDQHDARSYDGYFQHQFFVGSKLMAAPVIQEGQSLKKVYLPAGKWLDWNTETIYSGPAEVIVDAPLERLPLFLREGAIIPSCDVIQYVGEKPMSRLYIDIFPSESLSAFDFYEDDGASLRYQNSEYRLTQWTCRNNHGEIEFRQQRTHDGYRPTDRTIELRIHGQIDEPSSVLLDNVPLHKDADFHYDSDTKILTVTFEDNRSDRSLTIR